MIDKNAVLSRNKIVNNYFGCASIEGALKDLNLNVITYTFSYKKYEIGTLKILQPGISIKVLRDILRGSWDGEDNEFFKHGDKVDFAKEPIMVIRNNFRTPYIFVGNTRAIHVYHEYGPSGTIEALTYTNPHFEEYIQNAEMAVKRKLNIKTFSEKGIDLVYLMDSYKKMRKKVERKFR